MKQKLTPIFAWIGLFLYIGLSIMFLFDITKIAFYLYIISAIALIIFLILQFFRND